MSKIRIYELAKELGVENKVVVAKAIELGMQGKASHSNSLDPDEADKLRRAIIRQAIGSTPKSEVVTTRVDRVTGQAENIVESRSGNVIRRRKSASSGSNLAQAVDLEVGGAPVAEEPAQASPVLDSELFEAKMPEAEPQVEVVEEVETPQEEPQVEVREVVETPEPANVESAPDEPKKPTVGPKVLGKIALPQKRVAKPEARRPATNAVAAPVEEAESDEKKGPKKRSKKREFTRLDLVDYEGRDGGRRGRGGLKSSKRDEPTAQRTVETAKPKASKRVIKMSESITVGELAKQMSLKAGEVIAKLMELGMMATINQALDKDTAEIVASEFEFQIETTTFDESEILGKTESDDPASLQHRAPVVTVMGHVDHGKTSLLDSIRNASVAAREHGGITQHIGAYRVVLEDGRTIAFIDTPGHAAFTSMRARGAGVTDIVILVVAADEGVMPQTIEAINHAKAANVPIIVAMNKMDKPGAQPDRIKQQLVEHGLQPEDWGGDTMFFPVSAQKKTGIKELLEGVLLVAEVKELKANPNRKASGTIIEAKQDRGRGNVVTVLVQNGTLRVGDIFVVGSHYGRVRAMSDENGEKLQEAGPSCPTEITGFGETPEAGDDFIVVDSEAEARQVSTVRAEKKRAKEQRSLATGPISLEEFARRANNMAAAELNVVLKADVQGSVEAVTQALEKLTTDKVKVRVLHGAVGGVTESDIQLAIASKAIVIGFGVRAESRTINEAESAGIDVRFYRIIYELIDDVKKAMAGLLDPIKKEASLGRAEVRNTFVVPKIGTIAGCFVTDGLVRRNAMVRLLRDNRVVYEGKIGSLRRFKDDAREVQSGYECGMGIDGFNDVKIGDVMDVFEIQEIAQSID